MLRSLAGDEAVVLLDRSPLLPKELQRRLALQASHELLHPDRLRIPVLLIHLAVARDVDTPAPAYEHLLQKLAVADPVPGHVERFQIRKRPSHPDWLRGFQEPLLSQIL